MRPTTTARFALTALRNAGRVLTAAELTIEAWRLNKPQLGLDGHESEYPDSNKVLSVLCGKRGLVENGYVERPEPKRYRITRDGIDYLAAVEANERQRIRQFRQIKSTGGKQMELCLASVTFRRWKEGKIRDIDRESIDRFLAAWNRVLHVPARAVGRESVAFETGLIVPVERLNELAACAAWCADPDRARRWVAKR